MKKKTKLIKLWNSYFSPRSLLLCLRAKQIFKFPTPSWRGMRPMRRDRQMMWEVSHSCWNTHYMTRLHYQLSENKCFLTIKSSFKSNYQKYPIQGWLDSLSSSDLNPNTIYFLLPKSCPYLGSYKYPSLHFYCFYFFHLPFSIIDKERNIWAGFCPILMKEMVPWFNHQVKWHPPWFSFICG